MLEFFKYKFKFFVSLKTFYCFVLIFYVLNTLVAEKKIHFRVFRFNLAQICQK